MPFRQVGDLRLYTLDSLNLPRLLERALDGVLPQPNDGGAQQALVRSRRPDGGVAGRDFRP